MKRLTVLLLCICMVLTLFACHREPYADPTSTTKPGDTAVSAPTQGDDWTPTYTDITNPIQIDPNSPGIITYPQTGEYLESLFLANVPGQKTALLLSARKDGTLDYIFSDQPSGNASGIANEPTIRLEDAAFHYYTVAPDGTCTRQDEGWVEQLSAMMAQSRTNAAGSDGNWSFSFFGGEGNIVIQCVFVSDNMPNRTIYYHLKDGILKQIPLPTASVEIEVDGVTTSIDLSGCSVAFVEEDGFVFRLSTPVMTEAGSSGIITSGSGKVTFYKFAFDGTLQRTFSHEDPALVQKLTAKNGIVWFVSGTGDQLTALRLEDGQYTAVHPITDESRLCCSATPDGTGLFVVGKPFGQENIRLEYYDQEAAYDRMADTTRYALGDPGAAPTLIAAISDEVFYTWTEGAINGELRQYRYAPQGAQEPSSSFTVYSLEDNQTVRTAVALWNRTHPDILCRYIVASDAAENSVLTTEDLITQLNTQLVNGEGPDVLILDGLPADSLMDKGFLSPLSGLDTSAVYPKLLERFSLDGTLYAVPGKMTPFLLGRATRYTEPVKSLADFADLVETKTGKLNCAFWGGTQKVVATGDSTDAIYYVQFADEVFDLWYPAWSDSIWLGDSFNAEMYTEFLTQTGRLVAHYSLETIDQLIPVYGEIPKAGLSKTDYTIINSTDGFYSSQPSYILAATSYVGLVGFIDEISLQSPVPYELIGIPGPDGSGAALATAIGALRAGGNTEVGLEFLQLMLSDEVQTAMPYHGIYAADGYPVTWRATPALLDMTEDTRGLESQITNDFGEALGDLRCVVLDEILYDAAREAALRYYEGTLTLEEAMEKVQDSVAIYLAEQQR